MSIQFGRKDFGLFQNYNFEEGTDRGWATGAREIYFGESSDDVPTNQYSLKTYSRWSSASWNNEWLPVDPTKTYTLSYRVKGLTKSTNANGDPVRDPRHYLGFACYDSNYRFIDLRNCGGVGNTYLSRDLNVGDTHAYVQSSSGWPTGADTTGTTYYFRNFIVYPATHPEYYQAHRYTRIGFGDYNIYVKSAVQMPEGDWQMKFCDASNNDLTWQYSAYPTPAGTPVARGVAGGTFNYCFGYRTYPVGSDWTTLVTTFTGETRNSGTPFRYNTANLRAMILQNYALPNDGGSVPYPETLFDRMIFIENPDNKYDFN